MRSVIGQGVVDRKPYGKANRITSSDLAACGGAKNQRNVVNRNYFITDISQNLTVFLKVGTISMTTISYRWPDFCLDGTVRISTGSGTAA
jgi:hypothetical protein